MSFPPSCFIIGAQKAGTTSLAAMLDSQSDICVSSPKEPHYFSKNYNLGLEWYQTCFKEPDKAVLIDASPDYSRGPTSLFPVENSYDGRAFQDVPQRISDCNPQARFIYVLRNPVTRTHSSYWHNIRANYEDGGFSESIRSSDRYLLAGDYFGQVSNYLQFFSLDRFHFILFEHLIRNPEAEIQACCEFLDVDYKPIAAVSATHKNASYQLNSLGKLARRFAGSPRNFKRVSRAVKEALPNRTQKVLRQLTTASIPGISSEDEIFLRDLFEESNRRLAELTGMDLTVWD